MRGLAGLENCCRMNLQHTNKGVSARTPEVLRAAAGHARKHVPQGAQQHRQRCGSSAHELGVEAAISSAF